MHPPPPPPPTHTHTKEAQCGTARCIEDCQHVGHAAGMQHHVRLRDLPADIKQCGSVSELARGQSEPNRYFDNYEGYLTSIVHCGL